MIDLILIDAHCAADGQTAASGKLRHISKLRICYGTLVSSRDTAEDGSCSRKLYVGHRHAALDGALVQSADCAHLVFAAADECHRTVFHCSQQRVLLRLAKPMNFIDKQNRAGLGEKSVALGTVYHFADIFHAGSHCT